MYYGLKQWQITQNIDNKCFKTNSFDSPVFKDYKYSIISIMHIKSFFPFLRLTISNVRMSEGTFCRVEVHINISNENKFYSINLVQMNVLGRPITTLRVQPGCY